MSAFGGSSGSSGVRSGRPPPAAASKSLEPRSIASLLIFRPVQAFVEAKDRGIAPGVLTQSTDWLPEYTQNHHPRTRSPRRGGKGELEPPREPARAHHPCPQPRHPRRD